MTEDTKLSIAARLYHMRRDSQIPAVWINDLRITIEETPQTYRCMTWPQAQRLVDGEPLESVLARRSAPPKRAHDWNAWRVRRREYLRAASRSEAE